eukprot:2044839-Rhodomonas_salina.1
MITKDRNTGCPFCTDERRICFSTGTLLAAKRLSERVALSGHTVGRSAWPVTVSRGSVARHSNAGPGPGLGRAGA